MLQIPSIFTDLVGWFNSLTTVLKVLIAIVATILPDMDIISSIVSRLFLFGVGGFGIYLIYFYFTEGLIQALYLLERAKP